MLKNTVVSIAVVAFFGGAVLTQVAHAGDDIWDLMNPGWWADQFDDDDDDWWRYGYGPYGPYGWGHPPYWGMPPAPQQTKKKQPPPPRLPE